MQLTKNMKYGIVAIVVIVVVGLLAYSYISNNSGSNLVSQDGTVVGAAQLSQLYSIANNQALADAVGAGIIDTYPVMINGTPIVVDGKPTIVYIGAEYCPYCAATRWGMILALMRFGNFTGLQYMTSSSTDVYPNTPTFTFVNASYNSKLIGFMSAEIETNTRAPLQVPTALENSTIDAYSTSGAIPFIDFANRSIQSGAPYTPGILKGYDWAQITSMLNDSNSTISQAIVGSADVFTARICMIDNYTPASVCSAGYVKDILSS